MDYASVMEKLGVTSHTKLEDVFIAANAAGYITGKMDQERQRFYINTSGEDSFVNMSSSRPSSN